MWQPARLIRTVDRIRSKLLSSTMRPKLLVYQRLMLTGYTAQVFSIATIKYSLFVHTIVFSTTHTSLGSEHALHQILCILCDVNHVQNRAMDVYNCMCVRACACVCVCVCVCVCEKSQTLVKKWYVSSSFISWLSFIHCDTNIFRVNQF